jgi:hypothetical protein
MDRKLIMLVQQLREEEVKGRALQVCPHQTTAKPHPALSVGWEGFRPKRAPIPMESNMTDG